MSSSTIDKERGGSNGNVNGGKSYNKSRFGRHTPNGSWKRDGHGHGHGHGNGNDNSNDGNTEPQEEIDEAEQCIICANRIEYGALTPCNHQTCHICIFRQRALYGKNLCLVCRTENSRVIITEDFLNKYYHEFKQKDIVTREEKYGLDFTSHNGHVATLNLLNFKCPMKYCKMHSFDFKNFKALNEHVKIEHDKQYCDICANNKKAFISELKLYTHKSLQRHKSEGDEEGFNGHPSCKFCTGKRFYSDDELFVHLREKHEKCHVCNQIDPSKPRYFKNYDSLNEHFREQHFVCTVQSCLDQKFVVFRDEFGLKAHMIKEHKNIYGGDTSKNGYASQLSTYHPDNTQSTSNNRKNRNHNNNNNNADRNDDYEQEEPDSLELKKMRLEERARHYLKYSSADFNKFQKINKDYEDYKVSADELLTEYKSIFKGITKDNLNILLFELSELFKKNSERRTSLMKLNIEASSTRNESEQFPSLPGTSSQSIYNFNTGSWGSKNRDTSQKSSKKKSNASTSKSQFELADQTALLQKGNTSKPVINRVDQASLNYKPTYLSTNESSVKPKVVAMKNGQSKKTELNDSSFPQLPKVVTKKPPRVNPINISNGTWVKSPNSLSSNTSNTTSGNSSNLDLNSLGESLPNDGESSNKKKKKQKQVLFHMGI
ncbi:hypothetical protein PACTADRAFT_65312 [Pachysolen tannophilus NRRL Y-2460]|uniref:RING-type E3 ubiquitin transferase n=1 Tax=Pachysolen tannophilus NRRL Y-2460 TaxID=669874 RepID=A0A1E4TYG3_PACTA|nr:hypothetical protein PACTADRAFT_65312 [Pachysolen tannophilus NRRL Y-2460]